MIVPFTPGGRNDIVPALLWRYLAEKWTQRQYVVENHSARGAREIRTEN
jgi:hypothetical protein